GHIRVWEESSKREKENRERKREEQHTAWESERRGRTKNTADPGNKPKERRSFLGVFELVLRG
ncbi:hypothetical protein EJB05_38374, partial [Eragrostis curvula]